MNVAELFARPVHEIPDAPAIIDRQRRQITFRALDAAARQVAVAMRGANVGVADGVLIFSPPSIELYSVLIAAFRIGAVVMVVEPSAGAALARAACDMYPPRALFAPRWLHALRALDARLRRVSVALAAGRWWPGSIDVKALTWATGDASIAGTPMDEAHDENVILDDDAPALLTFTSGTTGTPKAAIRTHGILHAQRDALASVAARRGEHDLVSLPIVVLNNLVAGATSVLPDIDVRYPGAANPVRLLASATNAGIERVTVSPALAERLPALSSVRSIVTGGGPVFPDLVRNLSARFPHAEVVTVYGSTEAEPIAHSRASELDAADAGRMRDGAGLLVGMPVPEIALRIVNTTPGVPLVPDSAATFDALTMPRGTAGEIVVAGAHVVTCYLSSLGERETKVRVDGHVWHRTGDAGYVDDRGRLWLLGRADALVRDARGTMYPFAVECAVREHFSVHRVAALGVHGRRVLVLEGCDAAIVSDIADALPWAALDDVVMLDRIPMDRRHNSKIDYPALRAVLTQSTMRPDPTRG